MIRIENIDVWGWEHAIRGMRNPMNSWEKSDSGICSDYSTKYKDGRILNTFTFDVENAVPVSFTKAFTIKYVLHFKDVESFQGLDHGRAMCMYGNNFAGLLMPNLIEGLKDDYILFVDDSKQKYFFPVDAYKIERETANTIPVETMEETANTIPVETMEETANTIPVETIDHINDVICTGSIDPYIEHVKEEITRNYRAVMESQLQEIAANNNEVFAAIEAADVEPVAEEIAPIYSESEELEEIADTLTEEDSDTADTITEDQSDTADTLTDGSTYDYSCNDYTVIMIESYDSNGELITASYVVPLNE